MGSLGLFDNFLVNLNIDVILLKIRFVWVWLLIASAILAAVFLVITLAQIEAGTKTKSKWVALTFCSLALVVGLIIFKPKADIEQIQYMPAPPPTSENVDKSKDATINKSASKPTSPAGGLAGGEKSQGGTGKTQGAQGQTKGTPEKSPGEPGTKGVAGQNQGPPSLQEQLTNSLQKKSSKDGKVEYKDPVLEEILASKRQAEENAKESTVPTVDLFSDTGSTNLGNQKKKSSDSSEPAVKQKIDLYSDGQTDNQMTGNKKESEQQTQNQQVVKARVLVSSLNVRDKESMDGLIIGSLNIGDIVEVLDKSEASEWVGIKFSTGQKGWVMKKYLKILP